MLCFLCCQQALLQAWGDLVRVWGSKSHSDLPVSRVEAIIRQSKGGDSDALSLTSEIWRQSYQSIHPSIYSPIHPFTLPLIHPSIIHSSIHPSILHSFTLPFIHPSIIHLSIHQSTHLPPCPSIYSFIRLSVCSPTHFSIHRLSVCPPNHHIHPSNCPFIIHSTHWSMIHTPILISFNLPS